MGQKQMQVNCDNVCELTLVYYLNVSFHDQ